MSGASSRSRGSAPRARTAETRAPPLEMLGVTWALALAVIYFGLQTDITAGVAGQAAGLLLEGYGHGQ